MDLALDVCDTYFLDFIWAKLVPLSTFSPITKNASQSIPLTQIAWAHLISYLPHPQAPIDAPVTGTSAWPREYIPRQLISLTVLITLGIHLMYFVFAGLSYRYIFNHDMMRHPRFLKNQVKLEIQSSLRAFPAITLLTLPWFEAEVLGYSRLYDDVRTYGYFYFFASIPL